VSKPITLQLSGWKILLLVSGLAGFGSAVWFAARASVAGGAAHGAHEPDEHEHGAQDGDEQHGQKLRLSPEALKNAALELSSAGPDQVDVAVSLPGEVSLNEESTAHVTPRVSGTAREVRRQLGDTVKKGEVLAILESRDLAEAQRDFLASKERLSLAQTNFERAENLKRENISAEKDYLAAKQALAEAHIEQRSASQKLAALGGGGGSGYALIAPLAGTIIEKHVTVGEVLSETTRAFTISDLSSVWVNVTVYAKDLPRVAVNQAARVRAEGISEPAVGTIAYLGPVVGELTRSATARIVLREPGAQWRPGLFATADVAVEKGQAAVVVDYDAVQTIEGKPAVFVETGGGFEVRPVHLGRLGAGKNANDSQRVEVLSGLAAGERYVSKNSFILKAELGKSEAGHEH
jgi:cobalt-zinc-cadmium efflux system membrane fusion protein